MKDLDQNFNDAFQKLSKLEKTIAPDLMLQLYAYHKQANFGNNFSFNSGLDVRSGFKFNAWMQLKGMSSDEAKEKYIELANEILKENKDS
ncbi:acyl-CoA-binding protein [Polaribacter dokdonensis]|uniref:acyl-CoA-binding protein n=1 Tax=Polaribacter dokdonensis TaxID=326329 RepID=UPI0020CC3486|nr:acyl-CoA-binding protein [Polaribacter dokdonensis]